MKKEKKLLVSLTLMFFIVLAIMTTFETVKQFFNPKITIWESHTITIIFSSVLATMVAYFIFRRMETLINELVKENAKRKQVEEVLEEQRHQLEETNKELESFGYSISHDLRAPLRAIDGFSKMILKRQGANFDEDTQKKFNVIRHNTEIMGQQIDSLLELSRLGRKALGKSTIDMYSLVKEVWEEIQIINPSRKISLEVKDAPQAFGDRQLIRLVYSNLLSNAVKFTKNRDVALIETGGCTNAVKGNIYYVKDNGAGFDMAQYDKLFRVFQRLHGAEEFEGTGIGLATIQRIINRHGGCIWAEGKVNEGATFYFSLPASQIRK